jgi:hypothetical protein
MLDALLTRKRLRILVVNDGHLRHRPPVSRLVALVAAEPPVIKSILLRHETTR